MGSKKYTRKNRQEYFLFTIPVVMRSGGLRNENLK
jgi:hypothetical protein